MPKVEIRETTIIPDADGSVVRLQLSDAPLQSESVTTLLVVTVTLPEYTAPSLIVQLQRQAILAAMEILREFDQSLLQEIRTQPHIDVEPRVKVRSGHQSP
jgi:hypothetical protein